MAAIETDDLTRRYGARRGIERVSLTVPDGSRFGFLGPNGAGKTTTIRVLLGFLKPTAGQARVFGRDVWRESALIKSDVGYLPGDLRLYPWLSGELALRIFGGVRGRDLMRAGRELAERFALDLRVKVRNMSRGMRQKLGLILALAPRPKLLILDEPTASLDPLMQETLRAHLRELAARGHTVFFSSHTLSEVEQLCAGELGGMERTRLDEHLAISATTLRRDRANRGGRVGDVYDVLDLAVPLQPRQDLIDLSGIHITGPYARLDRVHRGGDFLGLARVEAG